MVLSLTAATLGACSTPPPRDAVPQDRIASATLVGRSGAAVTGVVSFQSRGRRVFIDARVTGLPAGAHGFHIHEKGDCSANDASSAGGHFNPAGRAHGHPEGENRHAGDLPNLVANRSGYANYAGELNLLQIDEGSSGILGRSVVIHADPDDYSSQPAGNSGKRIACGVIRGAR